ncbi:MAG: hypothetical protein COS25_01975 [Candidatus Nealsonbacteria bacterium CG02_land_8_20_14_3_00_37_10]|uniref:Uncharacterized protein n=1 Tax=Candidatus Nealsonbacteria bacterium CG02_land_8_20_14_3_00_37_10 TaxID=1974699 RepID=A0A2M7D971_9BACT|nr:MAG: hypothetical protein COS25_01975 [Candidatus Nealsonbacteria bacterium CG02_land_8_20_14_3_00_37_10]
MIILTRIKEFVKEHQEDIILVIGVILISLVSFAAGFIVAKQQEKTPLLFEETPVDESKDSSLSAPILWA